MRQYRVWFVVGAMAVSGAGSRVLAAPGDTTADAVLGQADFATGAPNRGGTPTAATLSEPRGLAVDPVSGRLFVPDSLNHRVLSWPSAAAFANGDAADIVIGQPNFTSVDANQGSFTPAANTLNQPKSVAVDSAGRLYVADSLNVRILRYDPPIATNMAAAAVYGQGGSFTTASQAGLLTANAGNFGNPDGIAIDGNDRLYCADRFLSRVTIFSTPLTSATADIVIGQPNLTTAGANLTQNGLDHCSGIALDEQGNLYVGDEFNNRVMLFLAPLSNGKDAARVFGQPDFVSNTANNGGIGAGTINYSGAAATVAVDPASGNLYVCDALNNRVLEYTDPQSDSIADRVFGQPNFTSNTANNGGRSATTLQDPGGVAVDAAGNLYVSDRLSHRVLRYNAARADLSVSATAAPNPATVGGSLTFTITVANLGPDAASGVTLTDTLSAGLTVGTVTPSQGNCSGGGPVNCELGTIASGASATVTLVVTAGQAGTASLTATVAATELDPNAGNDSATASATVNQATGGGGGGGGGGGNANDNSGDDDGDDGDAPPMPCGTCGMGAGLAIAPLLLVSRLRPRRRR